MIRSALWHLSYRRKLAGVAVFFLWMTGSVFASYLGFSPARVDDLQTWSGDKNQVLHFECGDPVFMRTFLGKNAQNRCTHCRCVLHALEGLEEAPHLLCGDDTRLAMTFVSGRELVYGDLHDTRKLESVMDSMERFYKALMCVKNHLPLSDMWAFKCSQFDHCVRDQMIRDDLKPLLDYWGEEFLPQLYAQDLAVVHRDLHGKNILLHGDQARILDYDECRQGYVMEDLMRLSVCHGLKPDGDQMLLQRWFPGDKGASRLFEACKALEYFSWAIGGVMPVLSTEDARDAVFAQNTPPIDLSWVPRACTHNQTLPDQSLEFLSASVRDFRMLCESE